jgi:Fe-S-cluster containining protein
VSRATRHTHRPRQAGPVPTGSPCDACAAKCCRYLALQIDEPEDREDFEDLRWYLCHERTVLYVTDGDWYLHVENDCRFRDDHNRCSIYERRPTMCRQHSPAECERGEPWEYDLKFTELEELERFIAARFA